MRFLKTIHAALGVAIVAAMMLACVEDPTIDNFSRPEPVKFQPLTTRSAVLNNIQVSYNNRNIDTYTKLLDPGFTFFPTAVDVKFGLPDHWGYSEEVDYNAKLFDKNYTGDNHCLKIEMGLEYGSPIQWDTVTRAAYPGETLYQAVVYYVFQIDIVTATDADHQFISPTSARAEFVVRNIGTDEDPQWRLAEMRDLGAGATVATAPVSAEQSTWGRIKGIYQ